MSRRREAGDFSYLRLTEENAHWPQRGGRQSASCLLSAIYGLPQRYVPAKTTPSRRAKFKLRVLHGRSQRRHLGRFEGGASG